MPRFIRLTVGVGALAVVLGLLAPGLALAHERRTVGTYTFVVGFLTEPAIQNQPNGLDLTITDANGNPVEGAEKTLKVAIAYGGGTPKDLPLRARFGLKGKYTTDVIPTKPGTYAFIFTGTLNGTPINERFESGPTTFDDVQSPTAFQFPDTSEAAAQASAATEAAIQRATLVGAAGLAVGLIGIVLGVVALASRPRLAAPVEDESTPRSASPSR